MNNILGGKMNIVKDEVQVVLYNQLKSELNVKGDDLVPKIFHLVWIGEKELSYMSEICIKSIRNHNPDYRIVLHYTNCGLQNHSNIISLMKEYNLELNHINNITEIDGVNINRVTGQSDLIRLLVVNLYGGIYIDLDIIILKSFEDLRLELLQSQYCITVGFEETIKKKKYINNGLIMGKKNNGVITDWLKQFSSAYKSTGWSEHGVVLITKMYETDTRINAKPSYCFHPISWQTIKKKLQSNISLENREHYCVHLFNKTIEDLMAKVDTEKDKYLENNKNLLVNIIEKGLENINIEYDNRDHHKIIFYTDSLKPIQIYSLKSIRHHNPSIPMIIFTRENLNTALVKELDITIVKITHTIINIDRLKFYILNKYGGLYMDLDIICIQSLSPIFEVFDEQNIKDGILVCKELDKKGFYINDGVILSKYNNPIINTVYNQSGNFPKALNREYNSDKSKFILLSNFNFNPINFWDIANKLKSETIEEQYLFSAFCVNLFAKSSQNIFDEALANEYSFLNYIIDIGIGKKILYKNKFDEEISYINLYHRPERNLFFIATWSRLFTKLNRFNAIKTEGKINGCGKSHQTIIQNSQKDFCLVLEDDAIPDINFCKVFPTVLEYAKNNINDYDLLTLATPTLLNGTKKTLTAEKINDNLIKIGNCSSSHFIIYTKSILKYFDKFYYELENNKTKETNQDWYFNMAPEIRKVVSYPFLSFQYFGFCSDVVSINREESFFKKGMKQLEIIKENLDKGITTNLYKKIPKNLHF